MFGIDPKAIENLQALQQRIEQFMEETRIMLRALDAKLQAIIDTENKNG